MEMPVEVLERMSSRPKMVADPKMNLEQLRRKQEATRKQWWQELQDVERESDTFSYERNKHLDASIAIAKLKLLVSFIDNGESTPENHGYTNEECDLLRDFDGFVVYDRLSPDEIATYIKRGTDDRGILTLAKHAAAQKYNQINEVIAEKNIPNDLAFAFMRIYQERIKKMQLAAAKYVEQGDGLVQTYEDVVSFLMRAQQTRVSVEDKINNDVSDRLKTIDNDVALLDQREAVFQQNAIMLVDQSKIKQISQRLNSLEQEKESIKTEYETKVGEYDQIIGELTGDVKRLQDEKEQLQQSITEASETDRAKIESEARRLDELTEQVMDGAESMRQDKEIFQRKIEQIDSITEMVKEEESFADEAVTAEEAKLLERSYIGQVEAKLKETGGQIRWKGIEISNNMSEVDASLSDLDLASVTDIEQKSPQGLEIKAFIEERKGLSKVPTVLLQVKVIHNYKQLYLNGFDSKKMSVSDISRHSSIALERSGKCYYILALVSSTGWSDKAIEFVKQGSSLSPNVSLALVNLRDRQAYYDQADRRLAPYIYYLNLK